MAQIMDVSLNKFIEDANNRQLFVWGAGIRARRFIEECDILNNLVAIVDSNPKLQGTMFETDGKSISIISPDEFFDYVKRVGTKNVTLLITAVLGSKDILDRLSKINLLKSLEVYLGELLLSYYEPQEIIHTAGPQIIPKKIHYCWFGKNEMPVKLQKCVESWYEKCPDYEIVRWDESNYDIRKNRYMREAYDCQKWGFVPDYARLDIIYNEGGIYLDTDVELINNLDIFLSDKAFFGFAGEFCINAGLGFGAVPRHEFIKNLIDVYENASFYEPNGELNLKPCTHYQHPVFKGRGFSLKNEYQKIDGIVLYPSEVFSPLGIMGGRKNFTNNTVSIHYGALSWLSEEERKNCDIYR